MICNCPAEVFLRVSNSDRWSLDEDSIVRILPDVRTSGTESNLLGYVETDSSLRESTEVTLFSRSLRRT
jgi:hypothetical protein